MEPVIAALLFTNVAFELGKFAPQMNIMIVAFPFQILVGLCCLVSLEIIKILTKDYISSIKALFLSLFFWAAGG